MSKTPATLERVGACLYGPSWRNELSRELGINRRTLLRWLSREFDIPEGVWADLTRIAEARQKELAVLVKLLS